MEKKYSSPNEAKLPLKQAIPLGFATCFLAMFVGNLTPILIFTSACVLFTVC